MKPYQDIVRAWAAGEPLEGLTPEQQRAVGLIASGTATDAQLAAAGSEFVVGIKAHLGFSMRDSGALSVKADESRANVLRWKYSDEKPDRMGDIIRQDGWDLANYKRNPVILWGHAHGFDAVADEPIGKSLDVWVEGKALYGDILFDVEDERSARIYRKAKAGFVGAGSVGFRPLETKYISDESERTKLGLGRFGVLFTRAELLEFSLCAIPANPNALQQAVKSGTITAKDAEELEAARTERDWERYMKKRARASVSVPAMPKELEAPALRAVEDDRISRALESIAETQRALAPLVQLAPALSALAHSITDLGGCLSAPRQVAPASPGPATKAPAPTAFEAEILSILEKMRTTKH